MAEEVIKSDILCVGGGIAGLMAAIKAADLGADVVVAEKGNALYSGAGRSGNDHFWCYIPEIHGGDIDAYIKESFLSQLGPACSLLDSKIVRTWMEKSFEMVKLWDEWGIPMKYHDKYEFSGHSFPGRPLTHLKYSGKNQKKVLVGQAVKRGVRVINRVMVLDLLGNNNRVTGAIGIDTREDKLVKFQAKSVILASGMVTRMYPATTPTIMGNDTNPFTLSGDGRAMAYRMGAELMNMEMISRHIGLRYFVRAGQATWIGVYRDALGKPLGPYVTKPDRKYGDILPEVDKQILARVFESGGGPVYFDCTGISDEDYEYMKFWLINEGNEAVLNYFEEEHIDPRKNPLEFMTYKIDLGGRIYSNEKTETTVKGLYSAGEETTFSMSGAAVFGWIAGECAYAYASAVPFSDTEADTTFVDERRRFVEELQSRKQGTDWKDANVALQQIMQDYAGLLRSEPMLKAGLTHLRKLKAKASETLKADNRWELIRCLEVLNLFDIGETLFLSALERKESRGLHRRADYQLTDPTLNDKVLVIKKVGDGPVLEWKNRDR